MKVVCFILVCSLFVFTAVNAQLEVNSSGDVGIGLTNPAEKLHINGSIRGDQSAGALKIKTTGGYTIIGPYNSAWSHFYTDNTYFYFNKGISVNGGYIGSYDEDLHLVTGTTSRMTIDYSTGNVGIGDYFPSYKLNVNGDIASYGVVISSDERLKKDIVDFNAQKISNLFNLNAKTYIKDNSLLDIANEIPSSGGDTVSQVIVKTETEIDTTRKIGFIAQEVLEYFPNLVKQDNNGFYSIDYISLIPVMVEAIKEQQAELISLQTQINNLSSTPALKGASIEATPNTDQLGTESQ